MISAACQDYSQGNRREGRVQVRIEYITANRRLVQHRERVLEARDDCIEFLELCGIPSIEFLRQNVGPLGVEPTSGAQIECFDP